MHTMAEAATALTRAALDTQMAARGSDHQLLFGRATAFALAGPAAFGLAFAFGAAAGASWFSIRTGRRRPCNISCLWLRSVTTVRRSRANRVWRAGSVVSDFFLVVCRII